MRRPMTQSTSRWTTPTRSTKRSRGSFPTRLDDTTPSSEPDTLVAGSATRTTATRTGPTAYTATARSRRPTQPPSPTLHHPAAGAPRLRVDLACLGVVRAGQVGHQERPHGEP